MSNRDEKRLVWIQWFDARGVNSEWQDLEVCEKEELKDYVIESVGFVIRESDSVIHISPHIEHSEGHYCGDMQIPKSAIHSMLEINDHKSISTAELHAVLTVDHDGHSTDG